MSATVNRKDISIEEDAEFDSMLTPFRFWRAELDGELSTGESARMNRQGRSAQEALENLERAISEQGWVIE